MEDQQPVVRGMSSFNEDLRIYLLTLKCFGILSISYNPPKNEVTITPRDERIARVSLSSMLLIFSAIVSSSIYTAEYFRLNLHTQTGNYYLFLHFCLACLVVCTLGLYFYMQRIRNAKIVQNILYFNRECLKNRYRWQFNQLFGLYMALGAICVVTHWCAFTLTPELSLFAFICYVTIFPFNFLYLGLLIVFYICSMAIIEATFRCYNEQLQQLIALTHEAQDPKIAQLISDTLKRRHQLLTMCYEDINEIYGIAMLFITAYILFSAPSGLFFLISVVFENKYISKHYFVQSANISLLWCAPWMTVFVVLLSSNGVSKEVNKTAKILSKIPRLGSGMERMVEKFLTRNLSQRPVFTAYGFYSLDKATLFRLFTAIFTYMVILVQFKEIESEKKLKLMKSK